MSFTKEQVNTVAWLARLAIDGDKVEAYAHDLSSIFGFVEQMSRVDTADVAPLAHPLDQIQRLRPDRVTEPDRRDIFLAQAPLSEAGLYLVPKVIE
jgi:aspartyl-tRNA(Asn)/glutamyl-tRNA(Gln) amidotransferase subunit C